MDEMKLKLRTRLMRGIVTKLISKKIYHKLGYKIDIELNDISIDTNDGDVHIHIDADGKIDKAEFVKILKSIGLED